MKTSFYFVLWIIIYPILGLFNNSFINENGFLVALAVVWGVSWLLNKAMPQTLMYERVTQVAPILEDVYTGNVDEFRKRLTRETIIETITAVYFCISTAVIAYAVLKWGAGDWAALIIFGLFTFGAVSRSNSLAKALGNIRRNPTREECARIAAQTYKLDCNSYAMQRSMTDYQQMLPQKPRYFKLFQIISIVFAALAAVFGLYYLLKTAFVFLYGTTAVTYAVAGMFFLYGSLAICFGVKDLITIIQSMRGARTPNL